MKYIVASLLAFVVLFLFAIFAVAVGWQHGGGTLVQASVFLIIATLWGATVKNWDVIVARMRRTSPENTHTSIINEDAKFTIIVGLIVILGAGLFFAIRTPVHQRNGITGGEFLSRIRSQYPQSWQYSDESVVWTTLRNNPDKYLIIKANGDRWK